MGRVTVGIDVGQRHDPSTLVVVDEVWPEPATGSWVAPAGGRLVHPTELYFRPDLREQTYTVRAMERLRLGTPYPGVASRVAEAVGNVRKLRPRDRLTVVIDATGVGRPVVELIARELRYAGCSISAATFTAGEELKGKLGDPEIRVAKAWLVSRLQSLFQTERIRLPAQHPEAEAMLRELLDYEIRVRPEDAHATFGAFRTGAHDDLVTALGLATLGAYRPTAIRAY